MNNSLNQESSPPHTAKNSYPTINLEELPNVVSIKKIICKTTINIFKYLDWQLYEKSN